jgi:hypothetical protein
MKKLFSYQSSRNGTLFRVFGLWFALNPWGNCFSPAVCLNTPMLKSSVWNGIWRHGARWILTVRFAGAETKFYWRGALRFDWDSAHIARRFGKPIEAPHGTCWQYSGWLGCHMDV